MSGYYGINSLTRQIIDNAFKFEIVEPNTLLIEEGTIAEEYFYIVLRGYIDIRKKLDARADMRYIKDKLR